MTLTNFFPTRKPIHQVYQLAKQVLIVDTSPTCVKRIADEIIELNHLYIGAAATTNQVEKAIASYQPDVLLINCDLSGQFSGYQIAKAIKSDYDIPFYMMCDAHDCETQKWVKEINPDGFIFLTHSSKPLKLQLEEILG